MGIDFKVRRLEIDGKTIKVQIWDTAGQEKFNAITTAYYRQARAAIVMYDTTRSSSFVNLQKWFKMIEDNARSDIVVALVGTSIIPSYSQYCLEWFFVHQKRLKIVQK